MEEVEEMKCEGGPRAGQSCRKQPGAKKLAAAEARIHTGIFAETVCDPYRVDAGGVKHGEVNGFRWERAGVADVVTELI